MKNQAKVAGKHIIHLAHSPDADDAFMFYGLASGGVRSDMIDFRHILSDIETLNRRAMEGAYDVTAISVHAYPYVADRYDILLQGASVGDQYGPVLVSKKPLGSTGLDNKTIAVPGTLTTAYLALRLMRKDLNCVVVPFDQIIDHVEAGRADAGLIIHEGQLTFSNNGLIKIMDLGRWWYDETGLPLPLGVNAIRKDLPDELKSAAAKLIKESILFGLNHRPDALRHALQFARGLDETLAGRFVGMYVNEETVEMSPRVREAIQLLLDKGRQEGIIPIKTTPVFFP